MFKKSDQVLKITRWNGAGEFYIVAATVVSCGKKQMVLSRSDDATVCLGRNFRPQVEQYDMEEIRADLSPAEAEARALELSAAWIAREIARYDLILTRAAEYGAGYVAAITKTRDALAAAVPATHWG